MVFTSRRASGGSWRLLATSAALALLASACGTSDEGASAASSSEGDGSVRVVATTSILGDVAEQLVGDDGEVEVLIPPGTDPHAYEASAADAATLREADLVVANGLDLEANLRDALEAAEDEGAPVVEVAEHLDPITYEQAGEDEHGRGDEEEGEHDEHGHGAQDPHFWLDAARMAEGVELLGDELATVTGDGAWTERAAPLADEMRELDEQVRATLETVPEEDRVLVTNHEALGYFADAYDFEILGAVIPGGSTDARSDPAQFAELAGTVEAAGVTSIFAETTGSTRLAEQLSREVGGEVEIVELYTGSLGDEGSGAETYQDLLRTDAELIAEALG